jgi:hypothetical protein
MLSKMEAEKLVSMGNNTNVGPIKEEYALGKVVFSPYIYVVVIISFFYLMLNKALFIYSISNNDKKCKSVLIIIVF